MALREQNRAWSGVYDAVHRYALARLRYPDLAQDIAQQTMLKALEYREDNAVVSMHALALGIAKNLINMHYRRAVSMDAVEAANDIACVQPLPDHVVANREELAAMTAALLQMPPLRREVFVRRRVDGESCDTICRALDLKPKAVEKHISRALMELRSVRAKWLASSRKKQDDGEG